MVIRCDQLLRDSLISVFLKTMCCHAARIFLRLRSRFDRRSMAAKLMFGPAAPLGTSWCWYVIDMPQQWKSNTTSLVGGFKQYDKFCNLGWYWCNSNSSSHVPPFMVGKRSMTQRAGNMLKSDQIPRLSPLLCSVEPYRSSTRSCTSCCSERGMNTALRRHHHVGSVATPAGHQSTWINNGWGWRVCWKMFGIV